MGKQQRRALELDEAARAEEAEAQADMEQREATRAYGIGELGSEAQLARGDDPYDASYSQRYEVDTEAYERAGEKWKGTGNLRAKALAQERLEFAGEGGTFDKAAWQVEKKRLKGLGAEGYIQDRVERGNKLLEEAEALSRSGDIAGAERLREQAEEFMGATGYGKARRMDVSGTVEMGDISDKAKLDAAMSGKMGQAAGQIVKEGREILDRESETSRAYRRSLTEGATRAIAVSSRAQERRTRDVAMRAGGARRFGTEQAVAQRGQDALATKRAQVETAASAQYEEMRTQFAADSVKFGKAFIDNAAGIRDQFTQSLNQMTMASMVQLGQQAERQFAWAELASREDMAQDARRAEMTGQLIGAGMSLVGAGAGMAAGGGGGT